MDKHKFKLGIVLFLLGITGILSILTMDVPLPEEVSVILTQQFTPLQIKLLTLINPLFLLVTAVVLGLVSYDRVHLTVPIIESAFKREENVSITAILKYGLIGGLISGLFLLIYGYLSQQILPQELLMLGEKLKPSILARLLYGGITEEILVRFGLMSFLVWIVYLLSKSLSNWVYWVGVVISSLIFGAAHFTVVFSAIENPSGLLLIYVLVGNSIGGLVFGWLYWKKGLESAIIAHVVTHLIILLANVFLEI